MNKTTIALVFMIGFVVSSWMRSSEKRNRPHAQQNHSQINDSLFKNPLLQNGADPWVYKKDGYYYYMATSTGNITIYKTRAMSALAKATSKVVWTPPASGPNSKNIWAPELHFLNNKWYLYYTAGATTDLATQRCYVLENSSSNPLEGTWIDKGEIGDPAANSFAIDGSVFEHRKKMYFIWSGTASPSDNTQRIYTAEMKNPWTLKTPRVQISMPDHEWEKVGGLVNEGPVALKSPRGDLLILFSVSQCSTDDYGLGQLKLKTGGNPLRPGDWIKYPKPVFSKNINSKVYGPGHNGFFKSRDGKEDWIIYHANNEPRLGCGNYRSPRMQKFTWKKDGTPDFGTPATVSHKLAVPSGE